jgi:hypothetical protein
MTRIRCYSELRQLRTFDERFEYLKLDGAVGRATFGSARYINQDFYASEYWKRARRDVIVRDMGCDLGIPGYEIHTELLVHHVNPMTEDDVINGELWIIDPEFLILTTKRTHNAIHYGNPSPYPKVAVARHKGDTNLW